MLFSKKIAMLLLATLILGALSLMTACNTQPQTITVVETVVVEKEVQGETITVVETVEVIKEVEVEKIVTQEVEVEKVVEIQGAIPYPDAVPLFIFERRDKFAVYHAKQSLLIVLTALAAPLVWGVAAWLLSWLPFGFLLGVALFSLVVATYIFLVVVWLLGMLHVSQTQAKPLPLIGAWAKWIPIG